MTKLVVCDWCDGESMLGAEVCPQCFGEAVYHVDNPSVDASIVTGGRFYILKAVARVDGEATIESNPDCLHGVVVQNGCPSCERRIGYKLESGDETDVHG